jgi:hypothetical protein
MKFITTVLLSSLLTLPAVAGASQTIAVEVVNQPSKAWNFSDVRASSEEGAVRVTGHIVADRRFGLPAGHVDISAYSLQGELVIDKTTHYKPRMLRYRAGRKGTVRFSSRSTKALPEHSVIKVAFHPGPYGEEGNPLTHTNTAQ